MSYATKKTLLTFFDYLENRMWAAGKGNRKKAWFELGPQYVYSGWKNQVSKPAREQVPELAESLKMTPEALQAAVDKYPTKPLWEGKIKLGVDPDTGKSVLQCGEYRYGNANLKDLENNELVIHTEEGYLLIKLIERGE